jgi:tRNA-binding EMAP/Myf-like protein
MEYISLDQLHQCDIRAGIIRFAEPVSGSSKLLRCLVEFSPDVATMEYTNTETGITYPVRQILSGIHNYFSPAELIDTYALYIINLEPRMMMGVESQGMLLAVGDNDCVMLRPHKPVLPGSTIH